MPISVSKDSTIILPKLGLRIPVWCEWFKIQTKETAMYQVKARNDKESQVQQLQHSELYAKLSSGELSGTSVIWDDNSESWILVKRHSSFAKYFKTSKKTKVSDEVWALKHAKNMESLFFTGKLVQYSLSIALCFLAVIFAVGAFALFCNACYLSYSQGVFYPIAIGVMSIYPVYLVTFISVNQSYKIKESTNRYFCFETVSRLLTLYSVVLFMWCIFMIPSIAIYCIEAALCKAVTVDTALRHFVTASISLALGGFLVLLLCRFLSETITVVYDIGNDVNKIAKTKEVA
jgi:hypothetical protein